MEAFWGIISIRISPRDRPNRKDLTSMALLIWPQRISNSECPKHGTPRSSNLAVFRENDGCWGSPIDDRTTGTTGRATCIGPICPGCGRWSMAGPRWSLSIGWDSPCGLCDIPNGCWLVPNPLKWSRLRMHQGRTGVMLTGQAARLVLWGFQKLNWILLISHRCLNFLLYSIKVP